MSFSPPKSPASSESFFEENRKICDRFFEQQEKMLELVLRQVTSPDDARILIQKTQETSGKMIQELLATQTNGLTLLFTENRTTLSATQPLPKLPPSLSQKPSLAQEVEKCFLDEVSRVTGFPRETIQAQSRFDDLGLDSITLAEIWADIMEKIPELEKHSQYLLKAQSIEDILRIVSKKQQSKSLSLTEGQIHWPSIREDLVNQFSRTLEPVDRYLLEGRQAIALKNFEELPHAIVLIGMPGRIFDYFRTAFEGAGIRVFNYFITPLGWSVPEWQVQPIPLDDVEGLRDALALGKNDNGKLPAVVMLAMEENLTEENLTAENLREAPPSSLATETRWTSKVEAATTALFIFAKAVAARRPSAADGGFVAVIGCQPMSPAWHGAVGVAKSASREWPGARIKSIWLRQDPLHYTETQLLQVIFESPHELDLEYDDSGLFKRKLVRTPTAFPALHSTGPVLHEGSNILILGGGYGISAEIGVKLAQTYRCRIIAIGRTTWSEQTSYQEVENENDRSWKQISRQRSLWSTHDRVCAAGGSFRYYSAEALEYESLKRALDQIRRENGPISGVIHGAGIIEDTLFTKKSVESFRRVLYTKANSVFHLYHLVKQDPLQFVVLMSSLTSYTGTPGQTDYAAANAILNAVAHEWNQTVAYPVKSMLWSVWTETGLVGPTLRLQMARMGLKGISTEEGVRLFIEELTRGEKSQDWVLFAPHSTLRYAKTLARSDATESL